MIRIRTALIFVTLSLVAFSPSIANAKDKVSESDTRKAYLMFLIDEALEDQKTALKMLDKRVENLTKEEIKAGKKKEGAAYEERLKASVSKLEAMSADVRRAETVGPRMVSAIIPRIHENRYMGPTWEGFKCFMVLELCPKPPKPVPPIPWPDPTDPGFCEDVGQAVVEDCQAAVDVATDECEPPLLSQAEAWQEKQMCEHIGLFEKHKCNDAGRSGGYYQAPQNNRAQVLKNMCEAMQQAPPQVVTPEGN